MKMDDCINLGFGYMIGHGIFVVGDFGDLVYLWGEPCYAFRDFYNSGLPDYYGQ